MNTVEIVLCAVIIILAVIMLCYYTKSKGGFGKLLFSVISGIGVLYASGYIMLALGYTLSANLLTLSVASILGIPGVLLLVGISLI